MSALLASLEPEHWVVIGLIATLCFALLCVALAPYCLEVEAAIASHTGCRDQDAAADQEPA